MFGWVSLAGVSAVLGGGTSVGHAEVVFEGDALRMPAEALRAEFRRGGAFQQLLLQHTLALLARIAIEAACSAHHPVEQRLVRLLLEVADRWSGLDLPLTQESLGLLLGVILMALILNGLNLLGINPYWQTIVVGGVLVLTAAAGCVEPPARDVEVGIGVSQFNKGRHFEPL